MNPGVRSLARGLVLVGAVIVATLLVIAALVRLPQVQRWVAAQVELRLPPGVTIERARLTMLPPGVRLDDVSFAENGPTLKSVSGRLDVPALFGGRVEISSAEIVGATLVVHRTADRTLHVAGALAPLLSASTGSGQASPAAQALAALPALTVNDATVTFVDDAARGGSRTLRLIRIRSTLGALASASAPFTFNAQVDPAGALTAQGTLRAGPTADSPRAVEVTASAGGLDAQTVLSYLAASAPSSVTATAQGTLDATASLAGSLAGDLAGDVSLSESSGAVVVDQVALTAPLNLSAHVAITPDGVALSDGQLTVTQLAAGRITATDITSAFAYATRTLHLVSARASLYGGTWSQTGKVTMTSPPLFDVTVRAEDLVCDALLTAITGAHPQYGCERLSADANVVGSWSGPKTIAGGLDGSGHLELRGGTIPSSSIVGAVWDALVPLVHAGATRTIGAPTRVDRLTQSFALRDGRMNTSDLRLITDDFTLTGTGSIGLNGTLNLNTEIAMTAAGMTKLLTMASVPIPGEPSRLPSIPTRITGTLGDPIVRPKVADLPVAMVKGIFRGAFGAGKALQGAAGDGLRALEDLW